MADEESSKGPGGKKGSIIIIKKIQGGHGGAHGGAWKVAYADFVTAMMAFFMVLWLLGADEETKASIASYFNNPNQIYKGSDSINMNGPMAGGDASDRQDGSNGRFEQEILSNPASAAPVYLEEQSLLEDLSEMTIYDGSAFTADTMDSDKVKLAAPGAVYFLQDSAEINDAHFNYLNKMSRILKNYTGKILVEATTDATEKDGDATAQYQLAFERAMNVRKYIIKTNLIPSHRLIPVVIPSETKIENKNEDSNTDHQNENRRRVKMQLRHLREKK
jgi:chemotaxis protein MotB